jgi:hypothetical protein
MIVSGEIHISLVFFTIKSTQPQPKDFFIPKIFLAQRFFQPKDFFIPKIFLAQRFFQPKDFSSPKIF